MNKFGKISWPKRYILGSLCQFDCNFGTIMVTQVFFASLKAIHWKPRRGRIPLLIFFDLLSQVYRFIDSFRHGPICSGGLEFKCGNFRIFLSLRISVKSILENLDVLKMLFFANLCTLNIVNFGNFSLQKVKKITKIKILK